MNDDKLFRVENTIWTALDIVERCVQRVELCYCDVDEDDDEIVGCSNNCGEVVRLGGFCSTACKTEWEIEHGEFDE